MDTKKPISAEDQHLMAEVEKLMAGDVHGARSKMCHLGGLYYAIDSQKNSEKMDLIRRQMRAYVARRKMGESVTMNDICKEITE